MTEIGEVSLLINGRLEQGEGDQLAVIDPARATPLAAVPEASPAQVDQAVAAARTAFDANDWRDMSPMARGDALIEIARRLRANADEFAQLDSLNVGKPIAQARDDVEGAAQYFDYFGRVIVDLPGEVIESSPDQMTLVVREPVGVVGAIIPWNFPIVLVATTIGAPLAAGNTIVLKPSELTPLSALRLAELCRDVLPPGVFNVINGRGATVGAQLASHESVDRIVFTGSTVTGTTVMEAAAKSFKRIGLELGGKSATVIFDDAPLEAAVASALNRIAMNQGENCAAGSRLLIQSSIYDEFLARLSARAAELVAGDPQDERTAIGPMISPQHLAKVTGYIDGANKEGSLVFQGETPREAPFDRGYFAPLSIFEAGPSTRLWRDEVFGPVLAVTRFEDEIDAVRLANDSDYGLMSVVWSGDRARGLRFARRVRAGIVRLNAGAPPINGPWGGFKQSGIGRGYGRYGIEESTEIKQINIDVRSYD